jgi:hypothetical protein
MPLRCAEVETDSGLTSSGHFLRTRKKYKGGQSSGLAETFLVLSWYIYGSNYLQRALLPGAVASRKR